MTESSIALSVVIPCYQQRETIGDELSNLHTVLTQLVPTHELILVIDGNDDGTKEAIARQVWFPELRVECFEANQGKGRALRHGLSCAQGILIAFLDAGGDIDPSELRRFLAAMVLYEADIVIGSKRHSLSEVSYPFRRRLYSRAYQLLIRLLFRLRVRDTQVGMKLFRREVLEAVLPRLLVKRFAFDLELLVVANTLGFRRIVDAPVRIRHRFSSSVGVRTIVPMLWDTLAVFYRLRLRRWYATIHPQSLPVADRVPLRAAQPVRQILSR